MGAKISGRVADYMTASEARQRFEQLQLVGLKSLLGNDKVLVIAPHPDDESLGCGGLIAACCVEGRAPEVVIATDGTGSHPNSRQFPPPRLRALREREVRTAMAILGLPPDHLHFLGLRDTAAPHEGADFEQAVAALVGIARGSGCGVVTAPWIHDPHCDHVAAQKMARRLCAVTGLRLLSYPVWGWTIAEDTILPASPIAGWRLDISPNLAAKRRAIAAHASQYGDVITDDPTGFHLPADLLRTFDRPFEVFLSDG